MYHLRINNDVVSVRADRKSIIQKYNTIYYAFECAGAVVEDAGFYRFILDDKHEICITDANQEILEATEPE